MVNREINLKWTDIISKWVLSNMIKTIFRRMKKRINRMKKRRRKNRMKGNWKKMLISNNKCNKKK